MVSPSSRRRAGTAHCRRRPGKAPPKPGRALGGHARAVSAQDQGRVKNLRKIAESNYRLKRTQSALRYRRVTALLRREGAKIHTKRVAKSTTTRKLAGNARAAPNQTVGMFDRNAVESERANQIWSWDFVHDQTPECTPFGTDLDRRTYKQCRRRT